jgi:hypothetical protein
MRGPSTLGFAATANIAGPRGVAGVPRRVVQLVKLRNEPHGAGLPLAGAADEDSLFTSQPESAEAGVELRSRKIAAADKARIDKEVGASTRRVSLDSKPVGI